MGMPTSRARGMSWSIAMATRSSAVMGMPLWPMVKAMSRAPNSAATGGTSSRRCGSAEVELTMP